MRSGAAAGHDGYYHEAALYGSDREFLAIVLPFLRDGLDAGEPTLVTLGAANTALVRSALDDTAGITFLPGADQYSRPASAIRSYREVFGRLAATGAPQIRVVGDVPHPGFGAPWAGWARYEAAANHVFAEFPLWGLCPYDTRTAPPDVLADVAVTHPRLVSARGHTDNPAYHDPVPFLADRLAEPVPHEPGTAALDLTDPSAATARRAIQAATTATALGADDADDLVLAVSEAVNNARTHGKPPIRLRLWTGPDRVTVTVSDTGPGPSDPYAGLLPATGSASAGLGLWMAHQMCSEVTLHRGHEGFTVRLVARVAGARA